MRANAFDVRLVVCVPTIGVAKINVNSCKGFWLFFKKSFSIPIPNKEELNW